MDLSQLATDENKVTDGTWVDYGDDGARIKVAQMYNDKFSKVFRRHMKPYERAQRNGTLSEAKQQEILIRTMSETILTDWEKLSDNGVDLPYSQQNAFDMMMKYKEFYRDVLSSAQTFALFKAEEDAEAE